MRIENSIGAPEHLDSVFFEDVLENGLREANIKAKNISLTLASSAGENYCSQIYRVRVKFQRGEKDETEQTSVIVKSIPMPEELSFLDDLKVYHKEKVFYLDILPKLEILLDDTKFAPRCYFAKKRPINTIAFEDMGDQGFVMLDREKGLDECHAKFALKKLAKFHAVSMVYAQKEPAMMSQFQTGLLDANAVTPSSTLFKLLHKYLGYEVKLVSQWEGYEEIAEKLRKYHQKLETQLPASQAPREGELKVLNHGDFWINNFLFKYEGNKIKDLVFLDFQMSVYGSPGIDLNYFFYASLQLDALKKTDVLLQTYYAAMKDTLLQLRYENIPTYDDIVYEFHQKGAYGRFTLHGPLPVMRMEKSVSEGNTFENLAEGDASEEKMVATFSPKSIIEHLKYSLKALDKVGALDF